jgi:hypothetical protein
VPRTNAWARLAQKRSPLPTQQKFTVPYTLIPPRRGLRSCRQFRYKNCGPICGNAEFIAFCDDYGTVTRADVTAARCDIRAIFRAEVARAGAGVILARLLLLSVP